MQTKIKFLEENLTFLLSFVSWRYVRGLCKLGSFRFRCALLLLFAATPFLILSYGKFNSLLVSSGGKRYFMVFANK